MTRHFIYIGIVAFCLLLCGCAMQKKVKSLTASKPHVRLTLAKEKEYLSNYDKEKKFQAKRDTFVVKDGNRTLIIMKAIKNDDGDMVAHDVIDAAMVTARFRNVAERHGKVDIEFEIHVPTSMQDSRWQLRFQPVMIILEDTLALDRVIVTGADYRKAQLKGYEQYNRFLKSIVTDSTKFVNIHLLEIFLQRNIPELYAFKSDSTTVSDEEFSSAFGVTEKEAIDHYTNKTAKNWNRRRSLRRDKMYRKYIKVPLDSAGIRLDSVLISSDSNFVYNYLQTIWTRPRLRKVDVILQGEIYQENRKIYDIPATDPLTFYVSSVSSFVDNTEKYLTKVLERKAEANTACYIEFAVGSSEVDETLGENPGEISRIRGNLSSLMQDREFDLDSIVVTASASPEGTESFNRSLSLRRSRSISEHFSGWMRHFRDSLDRERGFSVDEYGKITSGEHMEIPLLGRSDGENWQMLDWLVERDTVLTQADKESYRKHAETAADPDRREWSMQKEGYYKYMREALYPRLRVVRFDFFLHRKGMVKDTVHTTVLDSTYMRGVDAIRERDYKTAVTLLRPYNDYNTAIAYVSLDYNASAMEILRNLEATAQVNYMLAILYSRQGDYRKAVEHYLRSCTQEPRYVHRGNLDPEISVLIKRYDLNARTEDDFQYDI